MKPNDSQSKAQIAEFSPYPADNEKSLEFVGLVPPIRLIPVERVGEILGFKTSAVLELAARGELPQKIKFGTSRRASARWVEHEIYAYAWALAANREPVQAAETAPEVPPEIYSSASGQPQLVASAKKPFAGLPTSKSGGKAK